MCSSDIVYGKRLQPYPIDNISEIAVEMFSIEIRL